MYRFLWRPRWLLSHVLVALVVFGFISAGFWQLRRLEERRDLNDRITERMESAAVPVESVIAADSNAEDVDAAEYRVVEAVGTYAGDDQVLVANRSNGGIAGYWVVTPLVLADGSAVAINRGWVPFESTDIDGAGAEYPPPAGEVDVTGIFRKSEQREGIGTADAADGRLTTLNRLDVARLDAQTDLALAPGFVNLLEQVPPPGDLPESVGLPELGEGPHLNYAGQWFLFATVTIIGYPLAMRRIARQRLGGGDAGADVARTEPVGAPGSDGGGRDAQPAPARAEARSR